MSIPLPTQSMARRVTAGMVGLLRVAGVAVLVIAMVVTPGFFSLPTTLSLVTTVSFVGVIAVGMTLITISGNVMSFSLGATAAASSIVFVQVLNLVGPVPGVIAGICTGAAISAVQGLLIGWLRANPIIISIAALTVVTGLVTGLTGNAMYYAGDDTGYRILRGRPLGIPSEFLILVVVVVAAEGLLRYTRLGRDLIMTGASFRGASAAGVSTPPTVLTAYGVAGALAGLAGIMLATRYGSASMEYGVGYDYSAIAAVLIGGTAITGGQGSAIGTFVGLMVVSSAQTILLLRGFPTEWQYLLTGVIVLTVIMLQTRIGRR